MFVEFGGPSFQETRIILKGRAPSSSTLTVSKHWVKFKPNHQRQRLIRCGREVRSLQALVPNRSPEKPYQLATFNEEHS